VEAASQAGVLVTRAGPGFIQAVAELALGFMVDLSRGVSRTTAVLGARGIRRICIPGILIKVLVAAFVPAISTALPRAFGY
jgi:phosphoglycerate dehydrogenase-like enzyme